MDYQGEMSYMRRNAEKRSSLDMVLSGVQSVVCLRTNYLTEDKDMSFVNEKKRGDISLYALNEDYHEVLIQRHRKLEEKIKEEFGGCQTKIYIDTGPILEKPLAQSAGLGWVGKHTNLITENVGSYYFISEILVDVPLKVSEPSLDKCGTCRSCIDICPTKAIVAPYILDSRKCISYLTIELKGVIPLEFRKAMGNHIYGCDDCQIVCPWNSFAVKTDEESFRARDGSFQLIELMRLDDEAFRKRFKNSPVKRTKRRGLLRNVAVALGNSDDPFAVGPLIDALSDHEPLIRAHVVWALGELIGEKALPILNKNLKNEEEQIVKDEINLVRQNYS
ncbi:MAG: tRNA epoxyqueuosine(34) reductase QueG [Nitrospinales bacterium]|nr:tRNA epoxyqueuosine(34) reductase QueG [Nitrospinales bacterium]